MRLRVRRFGFYSIEYRVYAVLGPWLKQDLRITSLSPAARKRGYADLLDSWHRAFAAVVGESAKIMWHEIKFHHERRVKSVCAEGFRT